MIFYAWNLKISSLGCWFENLVVKNIISLNFRCANKISIIYLKFRDRIIYSFTILLWKFLNFVLFRHLNFFFLEVEAYLPGFDPILDIIDDFIRLELFLSLIYPGYHGYLLLLLLPSPASFDASRERRLLAWGRFAENARQLHF